MTRSEGGKRASITRTRQKRNCGYVRFDRQENEEKRIASEGKGVAVAGLYLDLETALAPVSPFGIVAKKKKEIA